MFDWLFEGHRHPAVYLLLAAAAVLFVVVSVRTRRKRWLAGAAGAVALAGLYFLLDVTVETDSEQIERKVNAMAAGFQAADVNAVFANVSDDFHSSNPEWADKAALRAAVQRHIRDYAITKVEVSDFHSRDVSRDRNTASADFRAKVVGSFPNGAEAIPLHCDATFDFDPAHGWRMRTLGVQGEGPYQNLIQIPP